jgi:hypothetical protein
MPVSSSASIAVFAGSSQLVALGRRTGQVFFTVAAVAGQNSFAAIRVGQLRAFNVALFNILATPAACGPFEMRLFKDPGLAAMPDTGNFLDVTGCVMNGANPPRLFSTYVGSSTAAALPGTLINKTLAQTAINATSGLLASGGLFIPRGMMCGVYDTIVNQAFQCVIVGFQFDDSGAPIFEL